MMFKSISKKIVIVSVLAIALASLFSFLTVQAAPIDVFGGNQSTINSTLGLGDQNPQITAAKVIRVALGFLGIVAIAITMYAGWLWMTAAGEAQQIEKAKKILIGGVIGLLIILSAFAITTFVLNSFLNATGANSNDGGGGGPGTLPTGPCVDGTTVACGCGGTAVCASGAWAACQGSSCGAGANCNGTTTPGQCLPASICGAGLSCSASSCTCVSNGLGANCNGTTTPGICLSQASFCANGLTCDNNSCTCQAGGGIGDACNGTTTPAICQPDSSKCNAALTCDSSSCTCQGAPVIDWLSPVDQNQIPNGAPGNFITIGGRFFGTSTGQVFFSNGAGVTNVPALFPNTINAACTNFWTDKQVIVVVPAGASTGPIRLVTAAGKEDLTNDNRGAMVPATNLATTEGKFVVNGTIRPGLCLATPGNGKFTDQFTLQGAALGGASQMIKFGNELGSTTADGSIFNANNLSATAHVPNIKDGDNTVFANVAGKSSNVLAYKVNIDLVDKPVIDYLDPVQGPIGQYVTIFGSKFLNFQTGSSTVKFHDTVANVDKFADVTFPTACQNNWWHDNYIIVKVPIGLSIGGAQIIVTNSLGKVSDPASFTVVTGQPGPGLCSLDPENGEVGRSVEASGDHFNNSQGVGFVRFFNNVTATVYNGWSDQSVKTAVPADAVTGAVRLTRNPGGVADLSNSLPFKVGKCSASTDCSTGKECCQGGSFDGICLASGTCGAGTAASSTFAWTFSTGNTSDSVIKTCAGYSTANACMAAGACPNAPGECQSSSVGAVGDCGDANCNTKYAVCAGACTFDTTKNICTTQTSCNESKDISGAFGRVYTGAAVNDFSNNPSLYAQIAGSSIETDGSNQVYAFTGKNHWGYTTDLIPVDTSRTYLISARFRSLGAGPSFIFLGFDPYDVNQQEIDAWHVIRYGNDETISSFNNTSITVANPINVWTVGGMAYQRSLGFYYNGDTTKLPDDIWWWAPDPFPISSIYNPSLAMGAYSTTVGNTINLNTPLPANIASKIILGTTKVKNHSAGGVFLYTGASNASVPDDGAWHEYGGSIIGEAFGNSPFNFRPSTKYVKLIFVVNYDPSLDQTGTAATKVWMDDLMFEPTSCNNLNNQSIFQIDPKGASCPQGSFRDSNGLCTLGTLGNPKLCTECPAGLACVGGKCAVNQPVCPSNSACNTTTNKCENSAGTCECCCRVTNSAQDCCLGLSCVSGTCGAKDPAYGSCKGCKVSVAGVVDQSLSDAACNCTGHTLQYCDTTDPIGKCTDKGSVGANCDGDGGATPNSCVNPQNSLCQPSLSCDPTSCTCQTTVTPPAQSCDSNTSNNQCDPSNALCSGANQVCDPTSCTCKVGTPVGSQCISVQNYCAVGAAACGADYSCITNPTAQNCRCCCDPTLPQVNAAGLKCLPDKSPCDGGQRGLYCGCKVDNECGGGLDGCGLDTCCRPRPNIVAVDPAENATNVCRNPLIKITFDSPMDIGSFSGNVVVAGEYAGTCPANTTYVATIRQPQNIFAKTWQTISHWFGNDAEAVDNFCAVTGNVSGSNIQAATSTYGVLNFSPTQALDANTKYYVIVKGDSSSTDQLVEGVRNSFKIGMNNSNLVTQTFNGVNYYGKIWSFTTKPNNTDNNGICQFDKVVMSPTGVLFTKASDSVTVPATTTTAYAETSDGGLITPVAEYNWSWSWLAEDPTVATVSNSAGNMQTITAGAKKDANTEVRATALITNDTINNPSTKNQTRIGRQTVRVFQCANPWPPITDPANWPWQDANGNCSSGLTGTSCASNNFEFYYCRDNGSTGLNDLPALGSNDSNSTSVIRGQENDLLKEYYFLRATQQDASGFVLSASPLPDGGRISVFWSPVPGAAGYRLYYGDVSGTYSKTVDTGSNAMSIVGNLVNGKKYYFAVKSYDSRKVESTLSNEVSATPADTLKPASPIGVTAKFVNAKLVIDWSPNTDDAVKYKVYYGAVSGNYGQTVDAGNATEVNIDGLNSGVTYYVAVTAIDAAGNESVKTEVASQ